MPVGIGSTQITGISVVANPTDAASKSYVDSSAGGGGLPSIDGNENEFLFTDGSTATWQPIQGYQEYTTAGNYVFDIPTQAKELFIEATGSGGGGGSGTTEVTSYVNRGEFWFLRTSGTVSTVSGAFNATGPTAIYDGLNYIFANSVLISSTDTITWTLRTSGFGANIIYAIAYASDKSEKYVIVGQSGRTGSSTDGISWISRTSGFGTSAINTVMYGNGFYVATNESGVVPTRASTDGISWVARTNHPSLFSRYISTYGNNYWVIGGASGFVTSSTDTITWIMRTSGTGTGVYVNQLTYGNEIFVLGTQRGNVINTSTDTITWTPRTSGFGTSILRGLHYGDGLYVSTINGGFIRVSTDGIVWIARTSLIANAGNSVYGNNIHLVAGSNQISASPFPKGFAGPGGGGGASVGWIISKSQISGSSLTVNVGSGGTSNTAGAATTVSWTSSGGTFSVTANGGSAGVSTLTNNLLPGGSGGTITGSNNYVYATAGTAGGNGGYFESSTVNRQGLAGSDATNATLSYQTTGGGGGTSADITGEFGKFGGTINYYGNTLQNSKISSALMNGSSSIPFGGLSYGAGGNGGGAQFGATAWVLRTSGFGATAYTLGYGNGLYIMAGNSGRLSTSTDTIVWVLRTSGFGTSTILGYTYGNDTHVLYGQVGIIRASTNGIFWEIRTSSTTNNLGNAGNTYPGSIYADGLHVTTGSNGTFLISTDSVIWTLRTTGFGTTAGWSTAFGNSLYLLSSGSGRLRTSTDNITWTLRTTGTTSGVNSLQYLSPRYYYFTSGGTIFSSTNSIVWISRASGLNVLYASAVSNNSLIAAGGAGSIYSSIDGITWISRTSGAGNVNAFSSAFTNNLFLTSYPSGVLTVADSAFVGNSGNGFRGGGGGGGGYDTQSNTIGSGGTGGDGYVRISWQ